MRVRINLVCDDLKVASLREQMNELALHTEAHQAGVHLHGLRLDEVPRVHPRLKAFGAALERGGHGHRGAVFLSNCQLSTDTAITVRIPKLRTKLQPGIRSLTVLCLKGKTP